MAVLESAPNSLAEYMMSILAAADRRFDVEFPVLIAGGGACGLVAALAAQDAGAMPLVLEQGPIRGGRLTHFGLGSSGASPATPWTGWPSRTTCPSCSTRVGGRRSAILALDCTPRPSGQGPT